MKPLLAGPEIDLVCLENIIGYWMANMWLRSSPPKAKKAKYIYALFLIFQQSVSRPPTYNAIGYKIAVIILLIGRHDPFISQWRWGVESKCTALYRFQVGMQHHGKYNVTTT